MAESVLFWTRACGAWCGPPHARAPNTRRHELARALEARGRRDERSVERTRAGSEIMCACVDVVVCSVLCVSDLLRALGE